ncbi:sigma-54-dependent Fis family transcriptional regulator [Myxococcota bacterium]|nr:sigma-54-dependent Fis family transcriptional regulator [Myxococcota bacterium]
MKGCLIVMRGDTGVSSVFVTDKGPDPVVPGRSFTAGQGGVLVDGVFLQSGRAGRVGGAVVTCLEADSVAGGCIDVELGGMVGSSLASIETMHAIASAGLSREPVLILGESGTGKELAAGYLGQLAGSIYEVNMGAVPPDLAEAELFGSNRGAFTGAVESREGALEAAGRGVLFLDELGEAPAWVQSKLLRAIDSRRFRRLGSSREQHLAARVVAATSVDPVEGVADGRLRLDLLERLACHVIRITPLRRRPSDIPSLVRLFCTRLGGTMGIGGIARPTAAVIDLLRRWPWPGNVRELKNVVARVLLVSSSGLTNTALVREALEAGRLHMAAAGPDAASAEPPQPRSSEIMALAMPRSTYYYRLKRGMIPSDTGPRRAVNSSSSKTLREP